MRKWISYVGGVLLILLAIYMYSLGTGEVTIFIATISLILAITLFIMASSKNYNSAIDNIKRVDGVGKLTIEEIFSAFSNLDTPLGKPWVGHIVTIPHKCIIWGPSPSGEIIYAYKTSMTKCIYLSMATDLVDDEVDSEQAENRRTSFSSAELENLDYQELVCYQINCISLLEDLCHQMELFVKEKRVTTISQNGILNGKLYRFDEDFKLMGQRFFICDIDKHPIYEVNGGMLLKNFTIKDIKTNREVFSMKKRLIHIFPHYNFYIEGQKYATFHKKIDLLHTTFHMHTRDGLLEMRSVNTSIGDNYQVKMNGEVIGTICEKLNLSFENIVFDNFVLHVREEKYTVLITALATMAAREMARDREDNDK